MRGDYVGEQFLVGERSMSSGFDENHAVRQQNSDMEEEQSALKGGCNM